MGRQVLLPTDGWLVAVTFSIGDESTAKQRLYVAGPSDPIAAAAAGRKSLAELPYSTEAECRFSPRALVDLGVRAGEIMPMSSRRRLRNMRAGHRTLALLN
jgi:hypothetical protein